MPHIQGHERGELVNRAADAAVRVLPNQQPLGNAGLPNVAAPADAADGRPPILPVDPPGGGRGERFEWLERLFGIDDLRIGEVPMAELNLNLAERYGPGGSRERREEGLGVLQDALNNIGSSEGEIAAKEVALQRLRGGGLGAGALRGQLAASQEAALRQQAEQFAQRGLGGGVPGVAMMRAQQGGAIQAAGTEAAFRENLQRSALQDINAMEYQGPRMQGDDQQVAGQPAQPNWADLAREDQGRVAPDMVDGRVADENHPFIGCRRRRQGGILFWDCPEGQANAGVHEIGLG